MSLRVFNTAVMQLRKNMLDNEKLKQARSKIERDKNLYDLDFKKKKLDLDIAEQRGDISKIQRSIIEQQYKEWKKQQDNITKGIQTSIDLQDQRTRNSAEQAMNIAKNAIQSSVVNNEIIPKYSNGMLIGFEPVKPQTKKQNNRMKQSNTRAKMALDMWKESYHKGKPADYLPQVDEILNTGGNDIGDVTKNENSFHLTNLSDDEEKNFQRFMRSDPNVVAWKKEFKRKYGKTPDIEDSNYDYRGAFKAGIIPQRVQDGTYHWGSIGVDGKDLKSPNHPTRWKSDYMERTGIDPDSISLPDDIIKTSEAMDYLINDKGMNEVEAKRYIRELLK